MKLIEDHNISFLNFDNLKDQHGLIHFITTRHGGYSEQAFQSLNLALHVPDEPALVIKNRQTVAETFEFNPERFVFANQTHSNNIAYIDQYAGGKGFYSTKNAIADTDALITDKPGVCLMILVADCAPITFFDPVKRVSAVAHAGWRGTVNQISAITCQTMIREFSCQPEDIQVGIGPCIGWENYEVKGDVVQEVERAVGDSFGYIRKENGKTYFELWSANLIQLVKCGIPEENIEVTGICTFARSELFFSSRFDNGLTGRFAAGIMMT
jgi:polyphenol oxidase